MIRPYREPRQRPSRLPILGAIALVLIVPGSILAAGQAVEGKAAAQRQLAIVAPACPAAVTERRP